MLQKKQWVLTIILIITPVLLTGCSTRSVVLKGTNLNLLNKSKVIQKKSNEHATVTINVTKWGPEDKIVIGYEDLEFNIPIYESSWPETQV
ncbi:MAG: hypothetical protein KAJ14_15585, partial [Candidatus Omnitrophica bacterium]|nr:hypothetical protein [Candidatus Omnitrophota bacterium]